MLNLVKTNVFNVCFPFSRIRFGSLWNEKVEESHQDRPESKRIDIQTIKGVQVKNVLPNNCANNNCLFE